jgi:MYXO-CTERM domain-containing protein
MSYLRALRLTCLAGAFAFAACSDSSEPGDDSNDEALGLKSLRDAAVLQPLDQACPSSRTDALCAALRAGDSKAGAQARAEYDKARKTVADRIAKEDTATVLGDTAVRYYLRERAHALLVYETLRGQDPKLAESTEYWKKVDAANQKYFPLYEKPFAMARVWDPSTDVASCDKPTAALVVFPDVMRILARDELGSQLDALNAHRACLKTVRVDTGSFIDPKVNVKKAHDAIATLDPALPLHLLGYGQGARNALQMIADSPELAPRVRSVLTLNSSAHGTEIADDLALIVNALARSEDPCSGLSSKTFKALCEKTMHLSTEGPEALLKLVLPILGKTGKEMADFIKAEDGVEATPTLVSFFNAHILGINSLTTIDAKGFFAHTTLPENVLYTSFRTVVSDPDSNLTIEAKPFYELLKLTSLGAPGNDMFVRLAGQSLGGSLGGHEILLPVAEGNHFQWALASGDVPDVVLPAKMADKIPRDALLLGYYAALDEVGLLTKPVPASPVTPTSPGTPPPAQDGGSTVPPLPGHDASAPPPPADGGTSNPPGGDSGSPSSSGGTSSGSSSGSHGGSSSGSHGGSSSSSSGGEDDEDDAGTQSFGGKKKSGCSATGGGDSSGTPGALAALALASLVRRRRKSGS